MGNKQQHVLLHISEKVATITLNRPEKLNAFHEEMIDEFTAILLGLSKDRDVRSVILTGAGRAFSAGADRTSTIFNKPNPAAFLVFMSKITEVVLALRNLPQPTIAAVNGTASGGGFNLVLACDIIIASETAKFSQIYSVIGIHPDTGGTYFLPRLVGTARACELMFTGRPIGAAEAKEIGMANRVVAPDQLEKEARTLASELTKRAPLAIQMMKKSIYQGINTDLETMLEQEARALSVLMFSDDHKEAISALAEKREAVFNGK
jgi:2-(1,2-epoxy-1,2-dihydrophenyl)acetyl-CoA isomerase